MERCRLKLSLPSLIMCLCFNSWATETHVNVTYHVGERESMLDAKEGARQKALLSALRKEAIHVIESRTMLNNTDFSQLLRVTSGMKAKTVSEHFQLQSEPDGRVTLDLSTILDIDTDNLAMAVKAYSQLAELKDRMRENVVSSREAQLSSHYLDEQSVRQGSGFPGYTTQPEEVTPRYTERQRLEAEREKLLSSMEALNRNVSRFVTVMPITGDLMINVPSIKATLERFDPHGDIRAFILASVGIHIHSVKRTGEGNEIINLGTVLSIADANEGRADMFVGASFKWVNTSSDNLTSRFIGFTLQRP